MGETHFCPAHNIILRLETYQMYLFDILNWISFKVAIYYRGTLLYLILFIDVFVLLFFRCNYNDYLSLRFTRKCLRSVKSGAAFYSSLTQRNQGFPLICFLNTLITSLKVRQIIYLFIYLKICYRENKFWAKNCLNTSMHFIFIFLSQTWVLNWVLTGTFSTQCWTVKNMHVEPVKVMLIFR